MEDEVKAARPRRLQREIDQIVADFRRGWQWPKGPLEELPPPNVGESHLKLVDSKSESCKSHFTKNLMLENL
jgi:hypothetical protein